MNLFTTLTNKSSSILLYTLLLLCDILYKAHFKGKTCHQHQYLRVGLAKSKEINDLFLSFLKVSRKFRESFAKLSHFGETFAKFMYIFRETFAKLSIETFTLPTLVASHFQKNQKIKTTQIISKEIIQNLFLLLPISIQI